MGRLQARGGRARLAPSLPLVRRNPMIRSGPSFLTALGLLGLSAPSIAQDQCTDLQAALDAAPPGATVNAFEYPSGCGGGIVIRKPVTLVGGYFWVDWGDDGFVGGPVIQLDGPGRGAVTIVGCTTGGLVFNHAQTQPGISGGGFDTLHVVDSAIRARSYCGYGYDATGVCATTSECEGSPGSPAIDVSVQTLVIETSFVEGSAVATGGIGLLPPNSGVRAPGAFVVAIDSEIHGGNAGDYFQPGPDVPCSPNERRLRQIPGGPAVECLDLVNVGSMLIGGRGGRWTRTGEIRGCELTAGYFYNCYQSPDGPAAVLGIGSGAGPGLRKR
jgi:hypothetical protein